LTEIADRTETRIADRISYFSRAFAHRRASYDRARICVRNIAETNREQQRALLEKSGQEQPTFHLACLAAAARLSREPAASDVQLAIVAEVRVLSLGKTPSVTLANIRNSFGRNSAAGESSCSRSDAVHARWQTRRGPKILPRLYTSLSLPPPSPVYFRR